MPINKTYEEQEAYCLGWKRSGISKTDYCKQNKISKSALYNWLNKCKDSKELKINDENAKQSGSIKFLRLNDIKQGKECRDEDVLEILLPNGVRIKVNVPGGEANIFLRELMQWK
jgi:hypothetical protein